MSAHEPMPGAAPAYPGDATAVGRGRGARPEPGAPAQTGDEIRLPRPPGVLRRYLAAHPMLVDGTIAGCYLFGCLLMLAIDTFAHVFSSPDGGPGPSAAFAKHWPLFIVTVITIPFVFTALLRRRRYPLTGFVVVAIAAAVTLPESALTVANSTALFFALYAVPVYRSVAAGWVAWGVSLVATAANAVLASAIGIGGSDEPIRGIAVISGITLLIPLLIGINLGNRRRYLQAIIDRAHQLVRERDQLARLAVAEERSRIARDMHDIVAHSVSVMIALSEGAARTIEVAPEAAADALRRSAETGRTALAEMRRLLGALAEPESGPATVGGETAALAPQPGVAEIPELVETFRSAGMPVTLEISGNSPGDRGQELAVYRVVQEALTNALRHGGPGAPVRVSLGHTSTATEVEVVNGPAMPRLGDGQAAGGAAVAGAAAGRPPVDPGLSGLGSGRGLRGLAERVRVFGGSFEAGALPAGGWRVRVTLPVNALASGAASASVERGASDAAADAAGFAAPAAEEGKGTHE